MRPIELSRRAAIQGIDDADDVIARARAHKSKIFDNSFAFVLDIRKFSTIIYMLYEGGELKPPMGA